MPESVSFLDRPNINVTLVILHMSPTYVFLMTTCMLSAQEEMTAGKVLHCVTFSWLSGVVGDFEFKWEKAKLILLSCNRCLKFS